MTKTQTPTPTNSDIHVAALVAVVELLMHPDFNNDFIVEMLETSGLEGTAENIDAAINELLEINRALATPLVAKLPDSLQLLYTV